MKLKGSLTLSVDMSKAVDTVNRVRLREAVEAASTDPFIVEVVGEAPQRGPLQDDNVRQLIQRSNQAWNEAGMFFGPLGSPLLLAFYSRASQDIASRTC